MAYSPDPRLVSAIKQIVPNPYQALILATGLVESGGRLNPQGGDGGNSFGPYQFHRAGRLASTGFTPQQAEDPVLATRATWEEFQTFINRGARGAELAYRAQRPANRADYVRKIRAAIPAARAILNGAQSAGSGVTNEAHLGTGGGPVAGSQPYTANVPDQTLALTGIPGSPTGAVQPGAAQLPKYVETWIQRYVDRSREDVLAGRPVRRVSPKLIKLIQKHSVPELPNLRDQGTVDLTVPGISVSGQPTAFSGNATMPGGYDEGAVDSGKVTRGGVGGDWAGSLPRALQIAEVGGLPITSQKRSKRLTASGNPSDHWVGSTSSYAVDLAASGAAGDAAFKRIVTALGQPNLQPGQWHNIVYQGYRYQVGWRTSGHDDHIHIGVRPA